MEHDFQRRVALLWGVFVLPENRKKGAHFFVMIGKVFPMNLKKQLACLYTNYFFTGLRITDAVWVALLAARGFSLWEIGFAESVFHIISLLCHLPDLTLLSLFVLQ